MMRGMIRLMDACSSGLRLLRRLAALAVLGAAALSAPVSAQIVQRAVPDNTLRATIAPVTDMIVSLDGSQVLLSPSAQIRDWNNFIIVPSALPPGGALADYQVDANGQLTRVWLLTPEEAARKKNPPASP